MKPKESKRKSTMLPRTAEIKPSQDKRQVDSSASKRKRLPSSAHLSKSKKASSQVKNAPPVWLDPPKLPRYIVKLYHKTRLVKEPQQSGGC